jgi:hypothetical protein
MASAAPVAVCLLHASLLLGSPHTAQYQAGAETGGCTSRNCIFRSRRSILTNECAMAGRIITVNDKMQRGYRYELTSPTGRHFDPAFTPDLTPPQMLELGVFCGKYLTDCGDEFPPHWFARAKLSPHRRDCSLNFLAPMPVSHYRFGMRRAGSTPTIRAGGSNGIAAITWGDACPRKISARSSAGGRSADMSDRSRSTANPETSTAAAVSGKHCYTGHTIADGFRRTRTACRALRLEWPRASARRDDAHIGAD